MKDIKDYFKQSDDSTRSLSQDIDLVTSTKSRRRKHKSKRRTTTRISSENKEVIDCETSCRNSPNEKSAKRSKTEHDENNATDLNGIVGNLVDINEICGKMVVIKGSSEGENSNHHTPKQNAFQFLMSSRNKVIGSNSTGKELSDTEKTEKISPRNLTARKKILEDWSDSIKARKRKLEDEEIDKCIKVKLGVRKKRFKALLKVENSKDDSLKESKSSSKKIKNLSVRRKKGENLETVCEAQRVILENVANLNESNKKSSDDDFESDLKNETKSVVGNSIKKNRKYTKRSNYMKEPSDSVSTQKSLKPIRGWKLKIKLTDENIVSPKKPEQNDDEISDVSEEDSLDNVSQGTKEIKDSGEEETVKSVKNTSGKIYGKDDLDNKEVLEQNVFKRVLRSRTSLKPLLYELDDKSDEESMQRQQIPIKVAPVFSKAIPKPKIDQAALEAKKKFLMSDIPETLKRKFEKQESLNIPDYDVFPKISHVYQKNNEPYWNLSDVNLLTSGRSHLLNYTPEMPICSSLIDHMVIEDSKFPQSEPIENIKAIIRNIKQNNSDYPVYKSFRLLRQKTGMVPKKTSPQRKSKSKRSSTKNGHVSTKNSGEQTSYPEHLTWTEKYKPRNFGDLIGNSEAVAALKVWLENWQEMFKIGKQKKRKYSDDSESEFASSDADCVAGYSSLSNTLIITGPVGSGKSSSVYAICEELGFKVIELNASSKRTGKQVIQEFQEATQSHQVPKIKDIFLGSQKQNTPKDKTEKEKNRSRKLCVLLIEDVDIVFEQDDGFISAISQIAAISKQPIILTTSNKKSILSQKFIKEFKTIEFQSLSTKSIGIWLQILCLLEGVFIDLLSIGEFLEYNKGDVRKTILQLQYWVQSGGQRNNRKHMTDAFIGIEHRESCIIATDDDVSNMSWKDQDEKIDNVRVHSNVISDFEIFEVEKFYNMPIGLDLKILWWNIPRFLNMETSNGNFCQPIKETKKHKFQIKRISDMYDSMCLCDISYRKISFKNDSFVCTQSWKTHLQDSLELESPLTGHSVDLDFSVDLNHYLLNKYLNVCKETFTETECESQRVMNMGLPGQKQQSQEEKIHRCEAELMRPVPSFSYLDRKSVCLDYLPTLRNIVRTEKSRAGKNVKRHNRFYNYLKNFSIDCSESVLNHASTTLTTNELL